ncbi:hypothetical protein [Psychrobacillus soli]|uniref:Uncharacterized protein n=1 Tax=Psychrobacillus soli TaxID=1543965 RepID=A0A544TJI4_9BACI|nr:hypothetical protein [Psychrobacillus soli]TQR17620.1 hypothetical protein FG383_04695 [Psychrobacillus soli]
MNIKKSKLKIAIIGAIVIAFTLGIYVFFIHGTRQHVDWLRVSNVVVSEDAIVISAFNPYSERMVSGYDYYVKYKTVYVKPRAKIVFRLESFVTENIVINDDFSNINKIIFVGKSSQNKTIWNKED